MTFPIFTTETQRGRMAAKKFHRSKSLLNAEGERGEESREKRGSFFRPEISALYKLGVFALNIFSSLSPFAEARLKLLQIGQLNSQTVPSPMGSVPNGA